MGRPNRHTGGTRAPATALRPAAGPRVLFLSCHLPWPPVSGGRRRELELLRRISDRFDVHLVVVSKTPDEDRANATRMQRWCSSVEVFAASPPSGEGDPGTARSPEGGARAPRSEIAKDSFAPQVLRHRCPEASARMRDLLADGGFELIHVEGFYLMQHVPAVVGVPVLLVEQNVEYELARQRAVMSGGADAMLRAAATERAERRSWKSATQIAAVTTEDTNAIQTAAPWSSVRLIPDGADHFPSLRVVDDKHGVEHPHVPLMVLLGNFGYEPNADAAQFMCAEILPRIRAQIPEAQLWLVGNAPPPEVRALARGHTRVTGQVPDVLPYLDLADVMVFPLRIGGGIKVKTIEAMRRGKAIVCSSIAAQGLKETADALVICDDPVAFANAVIKLLRDPARRRDLGRRAGAAAHRLPTWEQAANALTDTYAELLYTAPQPARASGGWQ
jgi:glycosyltransferase involved in cell wall biosynthesis